MKKLILIMMVGSLFAQAENTAIRDSLYLEGGQFYIGEYVSADGESIIFLVAVSCVTLFGYFKYKD